jgi:hypothetical protein
LVWVLKPLMGAKFWSFTVSGLFKNPK